jgi:L-fuconate dehydratase
MERNVLEFADHLHEHFVNPCTMNENGRYNVPNDPREGYRYVSNRSPGRVAAVSVV